MASAIAVVGAGSAALHHVKACNELGVEVVIVEKWRGQVIALMERYIQRYHKPPIVPVRSLSELRRPNKFEAGIVATPAMNHVEGVKVLAPLVTGPIYIEKPAWLGNLPQDLAQNSLVTGSQNVFRAVFKELRALLPRIARPTFAEFHYIEARKNINAAHSWNPRYHNGWSASDASGGGVHFEFSHVFYWLANLLGFRFQDCEWEVMDIHRRKSPTGASRTESCQVALTHLNTVVTLNLAADDSLEITKRGGLLGSSDGYLSFSLGSVEDTLTHASKSRQLHQSFSASRSAEAVALVKDLLDYNPAASQLMQFQDSIHIDHILGAIQVAPSTGGPQFGQPFQQ